MGVALHTESAVGRLEELLVLVAVRIESSDDGDVGSDRCTHSSGNLGFRLWNIGNRHGSMKGQVDSIERTVLLDVLDDSVCIFVESLLGDPTAERASYGTDRRQEPYEVYTIEFTRHFGEALNVTASFEDRFTTLGRTVELPLFDARRPGAKCASLV